MINQIKKLTLYNKLARDKQLLTLAAVSVTVCVLAGQVSLSRLVPGLPEDLIRVRSLALVLVLIAVLPVLQRDYHRLLAPPLLCLGALCGYLLLRGVVDPGPQTFSKSIDIVFLLVQACVVALIASHPNARLAIAYTIIACATALFAVALYGQLTSLTGEVAEFGFGWGKVIGAITLNRIEFLGFCVVLVILIVHTVLSRMALYSLLLLGSLFLFGTWGTLQKSALAASIVVIVGVTILHLFRRRWRTAIMIIAMFTCGAALTAMVFASHVAGRFQQSINISQRTVDTEKNKKNAAMLARPVLHQAKWRAKSSYQDPATIVDIPIASREGSLPTADDEPWQGSLKLRYCYFKSATLLERKPGTPVLCFERHLVDSTSRLVLMAEAIRGFVTRPVFGYGLASYQVLLIHPETKTPDPYLYPHNLFLEVAFEGGTVGLVLLIIALAVVLRAAWKTSAPTGVSVPVLGFAAFMAISVLFSGDIYDSRPMWLSLILLSFYDPGDDSWLRTS